jgi:hypothetical protein
MTEHPCEGLSRAARDAFERIAVNQFPACQWPVLDELLFAGVVLRGPDEIRRDAMGVYRVPSFCVAIGIHAQWCAWCAEQGGLSTEELNHEAANDQARQGVEGEGGQQVEAKAKQG